MLTGKRAFKGTTVAAPLSAIRREDPVEPWGSGPGPPAGLVRVIRRTLEKTPEDRFQTARDLAFALEGATTDFHPTVGEAQPPVRASLFPGRRAMLGLAVIPAGGPPPPEDPPPPPPPP